MTTLFLICGLPGSGKTVLAKELELSRPALRLSPDEWITPLLADITDTVERDRLRSPVESLQWEVAKRALALGMDVVLEWGFWSREERTRYRSEAEALGARVELRYLHVERDELWARLSRRNADLPPGTFVVTEDQLNLWWSWFESPAADELGWQPVRTVATSPGCVFCDVVRGEGPASQVWHDDRVLAFMDIRPVNPGHLLIVPRTHAASLAELEELDGQRVFAVAKKLAAALRQSGLQCEGINLFLADGQAAGQDVFHTHLHVLPRYESDGVIPSAFVFGKPDVPIPTRQELDALAASIRAAVKDS